MLFLKNKTFVEYQTLIIAGGIIAVLAYIANIVMANELGPETYGQYAYALVLAGMFGEFIMFGTDDVALRLKGTHGKVAMDWILTTKWLNFLIITIGVMISLAISADFLILLALAITLPIMSYSSHYESKNQNTRFVTIATIERLLLTASILAIVFLLEENHLWWVFGAFFAVFSLSLLFQIRENREFHIVPNLREIFPVYRSGFVIVVFSLSKYVYGGVPRILIFQRLGEAQMGILATSWLFVQLSTIYFGQTIKVWRRRITESLDAKDYPQFKKHVGYLTLACLPTAAFAFFVLSVFNHEITALLFSDAYTETAKLLPYIGIYYLVIGADTIVVLLAIAMARLHTLATIYLIVAALTALACFSLPNTQGLTNYLTVIIIGHFSAVSILALVVLHQTRKTFAN